MTNDVKVNDLPITAIINGSDKLMLVQNNTDTRQVAVEDIADHTLKDTEVEELDTETKKPIGAINELDRKVKDLDYRVGELEKMGNGLKKIQMELVFVDTSGNGG